MVGVVGDVGVVGVVEVVWLVGVVGMKSKRSPLEETTAELDSLRLVKIHHIPFGKKIYCGYQK